MTPYYRQCIQNEFAARCDRNPRYSLRGFAKALKLSDGSLSEILSEKRIPSIKVAERIIAGLNLGPDEKQKFLASLADKHRSRGLQRLSPLFRNFKRKNATVDMDIDFFRVMSDWYHMAILELTFVDSFQDDPVWIARQLGISPLEAKFAVERLLNLGLLSYNKAGRLFKTNEQLNTRDQNKTTSALKKVQGQILEKAGEALQEVDITLRNQTAMTMAIDPELIPTAKKMIQDFTMNLCDFLESRSRKKVYQLSISLFPLEKDPK